MRKILSILAVLVAVVPWAGAVNAEPAVVDGPVRFVPHAGTTLTLEGHGPFRAVLEAIPAPGGLTVVNDLPLDDYLIGVNEVPPAWPMEALKAQVVAARTYALWEKRNGKWADGGYDICPTTGCQVFAGAGVEEREHWDRWVAAVHETSGQVLHQGGVPILARYHASSGGRTVANHVAFPGSAPRSYLMAVDDAPDAAGPLHRWTVDIGFETVAEILRYKLGWEGVFLGVSPFRSEGRVVGHYEHGDAEVPWSELRRVINEHAPAMAPDTYPGLRSDGGPMPLTLPSGRYDIHRTESGFRFDGGGWGHGVGMSQWGAKGRADQGAAYPDILAHYYGGLRPEALGADEGIRVGIDAGAGRVAISGDGGFTVVAGDVVIAEHAHGTWTVHLDGGSARVDGPQVLPEPEPEPVEIPELALRAGAVAAPVPQLAVVAQGPRPTLPATAVFLFALAVVVVTHRFPMIRRR